MSERYGCPEHEFSLPELAPRMFSFNSPFGACPVCSGLGTRMELDPDLIVPDPELSLQEGAIEAWRKGGHRMAVRYGRVTRSFCRAFGVDLFAPAIGTAHGVYMTENPKIDFQRFEKIQQLVNGDRIIAPLIVHGGTGLKKDVVRRLVALGGAKFNVSTDLKYALIDSTYNYISAHRDEYNPGKIDVAAKQAVMERVGYWIDLLGCAGRADRTGGSQA